jgi:hypothetical protein
MKCDAVQMPRRQSRVRIADTVSRVPVSMLLLCVRWCLLFFLLNPNGERTPCGGRGVAMIDWSDPMPGPEHL